MDRCFIALDLPQGMIDEIRKIQVELMRQNLFVGKLTEIENIHLTLKFLGEIDKKRIEDVKERLKEVRFDKFDSSLGEIGVFSKKFVRIIWVELIGVSELQKLIDYSLEGLFEKERRFKLTSKGVTW